MDLLRRDKYGRLFIRTTVTAQGSGSDRTIVIAPTNPEIIYVPAYNPNTVYGNWPYPAYPPTYYPPPPGYGYGSALLRGLMFGVGIAAAGAIMRTYLNEARGDLMLAVALGGPAWAGNHGSVDVQWAQEILRQKGLFHGRPNGELDGPTRSALTTFQRSAGLPVSGQLDPGTVAKLSAGRPVSDRKSVV